MLGPWADVGQVHDTLISAEADAVCGDPYDESSPERTNVRNGYRHREFDTRIGTLDVAIPRCTKAAITRTGCWKRRFRTGGAGLAGGMVVTVPLDRSASPSS